MNKIILDNWDTVHKWLDSNPLNVPPTYIAEVNSGKYPTDAFSLGQLVSKSWLIETMRQTKPRIGLNTWAILGCWVGALVPLLHRTFLIERIYGFDLDPASIELAEYFNRYYLNGWKFKGVVADVSQLECRNMEFITEGELISVKPDVIINTSCEHMTTEWFDSVDSDQLVIMQTNNSTEYPDHINTCSSVEEMQERYPLTNTLYAGELVLPVYTRYMQIGYK
jgi:hypothetical protein